jgi:hypothetical protein
MAAISLILSLVLISADSAKDEWRKHFSTRDRHLTILYVGSEKNHTECVFMLACDTRHVVFVEQPQKRGYDTMTTKKIRTIKAVYENGPDYCAA